MRCKQSEDAVATSEPTVLATKGEAAENLVRLTRGLAALGGLGLSATLEAYLQRRIQPTYVSVGLY